MATDDELAVDLGIGQPDAPPGIEYGPPPMPAEDDALLDVTVPKIDERKVRAMLEQVGAGAQAIAGTDDDDDERRRLHADLRFTPGEINALAPILMDKLNRAPKLRKVVQDSDNIMLAIIGGNYAASRLRQHNAWRARRRAGANTSAGEVTFTAGGAS